MTEPGKKPIIRPRMLPEEGIREVTVDGRTYLLRNDVMFTAMQHAQGEFSDFFLSLRDEQRIFGHRCPRCRHLIVPPFMRRCPGTITRSPTVCVVASDPPSVAITCIGCSSTLSR